MILIFGGTTEGRVAANVAEQAGKAFYYSTKSMIQEVELHHGIRISGGMDADDIVRFCKDKGVRCMVDAAHPFATNLHANIAKASEQSGLPVVRLQRAEAQTVSQAIYCSDFSDAIEKISHDKPRHLLALSGANTIATLRKYWEKNRTTFRILNREESITLAEREGVPLDNIIFYPKTSSPTIEEEIALMQRIGCDAMLTKESGTTGGLDIKVSAALQLGVKVYIVRRPSLPKSFINVSGEHTLRRAIEHIVPDFFPLRTGLTTGSCATAAAKAALLALLTGEEQEDVCFYLPNGETVTVEVKQTIMGDGWAESCVIKDAGDDPDVTNGCCIRVRVQRDMETDAISFIGGKGVGTVTLPGLGIPVGGPAINLTPRKMIEQEIRSLATEGFKVTIGVDEGEELARKTFNSRVGVVGGISIIGTLGIVRPFSNEAFVESIRREIEVAKAVGCKHLVINSGAKSERKLRESLPSDSSDVRFVHYGNFIGETLKAAREAGIAKVTMGIMIGKAVKLAEGHLDTHSHKVVMNKSFIRDMVREITPSTAISQRIMQLTLARELWDIIPAEYMNDFTTTLLRHCKETCQTVCGNDMQLRIILVTE